MSTTAGLAAGIEILATDVDGTLTDGGMYYSSAGETFKRFSVRDGLAVKLVQALGIEVAFISSDNSQLVAMRAERLGVAYCCLATSDKVGAAREICGRVGCNLSKMAYLGDDLQDLDLMRTVGIAAAVGDAHPTIVKTADYNCQSPGGQGAFRELAEWLISERGCDLEEVWRASAGGGN